MAPANLNFRIFALFVSLAIICSLAIGFTPVKGTPNNQHLQRNAAIPKAEERPASLMLAAEGQKHLLIDSIDMASFGTVDVKVLVSERPLQFGIVSSRDLSQKWQEAYLTTLFVESSDSSSPGSGILNSAFYQFTDLEATQSVFETFPHDPSLIQTELAKELKNHAVVWRTWYEPNTEGLPSFNFLLQRDTYITQVKISTGFDQGEYGIRLINHTARKMLAKSLGKDLRWQLFLPHISMTSNSILHISTDRKRDLRHDQTTTQNTARMFAEDLSGGCEKWFGPICLDYGTAARWNHKVSDIHSQQFEGFCIPGSIIYGHISHWNWWSEYELGIPGDFLIHCPWAKDPSKYSAMMYVDSQSTPTPRPDPSSTPRPGSTPTPRPNPTQPPAVQGITVISVLPQGNMASQGQDFHPEVVIQTSGFSLDCSKSFLENRDGNKYGTHPIQGCTPLGGGQYRFAFGIPMKMPDSPGEYHSKWQVWNGSAHIGPEIDIWFRVARPTDNNRPPANPKLVSPGDVSEIRSATAPELCWNPVSDPDGEPVEYYAEVFESAKIDNSGWITGTCWRPRNLDGQYFGYQWRVKARDERDAESGWSERWRFTLSPPPYDPAQPTSTPQEIPTQRPTIGGWWNIAYHYRRLIPIATNAPLSAGTLIKVDGLDLNTLVTQGKAQSDRNDIRIVRRISDNTWQEVSRVIYSEWDLEFRLLADIPAGTDSSYYLYYGNSSAGSPPIFSLPQGWWVDMYLDKWWSSYVGTWEHDQAMDFSDVCEPPLSHRQRTNGSAFDDSDKFRGRLFVPTTGRWTFSIYTNDGYALYLDGQEIGRFDGYESNRSVTIGSRDLKAGWYTVELRNMWVNCGAWKFSMSGPGFNQIVPSNYFQRVWGNVRTGVTPGVEETQGDGPSVTPTSTANTPPASTPTNISTATPVPVSWWVGDGRDGSMPNSGNLDNNNGFGVGSVNGSAGSSSISVDDRHAVWRVNPGDYVLLHQTRGEGAGHWELNRAASDFTGNGTFTLANPLQRTYVSNGYQNRAQIMRVPQYATCNVTGTVAPLMSWNGDVGGIFVVMCQSTLNVSGSINVDGTGFRGGDSGNGYATDQWQGEGVLCMRNNADHFCKSPDTFSIDQGGGAADQIGGGGGGGGFVNGSDGDHIGGSNWGQGGRATGSPDGSTRFLGGGGGGGATSINPGTGYSKAGSGGGLIYIFAQGLTVSGQITSRGQQASGVMYDDGTNRRVTAGSGGGGQIFIRVGSASLGTNQVVATGGPQLVPPSGGTGRFGGGTGGDGHVRVEYCDTRTGSTSSPSNFQQRDCSQVP